MSAVELGTRPGDVIAGKFRVERVIGQGGMAVVVAATHLELHEEVAIKLLLPELASRGELVERFLREARAAVKIKGEHVVRVSDVGRLESGAPYMVMEYLEGTDLLERVSSEPLSIEAAAEYILQVCEAVASAHALGIVHRDLKPANLFLITREDGSPCVKVLDFGISKSASPGDAAVTKTSASLGTPLYMAPEQMTSTRTADARADIWALGVTFHELVTGKTPFVGETMPQICAAVLQGEPTRLRDALPDAPEALEAVVLRCLEKQPASRYASVAELAEALAPFAPEHARKSVARAARALARASRAPIAPASARERLPSDASGADTLPASAALTPAAAMAAPPAAHETRGEWDQVTPPPPKRSHLAAISIVAALVGAVTIVLAFRGPAREPTVATGLVATASSAAAALTAEPVIEPGAAATIAELDPPGPPVVSASAAASASASAVRPAASAAPTARAPWKPRPPQPATAAPKATADPFSKRSW